MRTANAVARVEVPLTSAVELLCLTQESLGEFLSHNHVAVLLS
jgi:hypothetical protein